MAAFGVNNGQNNKFGIDVKNWQPSSANNSNGLPLPSGLSEKDKKEQLELAKTKPKFVPDFADDYVKENADKSLQAITYSKAIYPVEGDFLENALQGDGKARFYGKDSFVASKIANSQPLRDFMVQFKDKKEHEIKGLKGSIEFASNSNNKDLYYAVGKCNFEIKGVRENADGSKSITLVLSDDYDFDSYRYGGSPGSYMNNIGVIGQLCNQIKPYSWQAEVEYTYNKNFSDLDSKNEA